MTWDGSNASCKGLSAASISCCVKCPLLPAALTHNECGHNMLYIIVLPDVAARGPRCCRLRDGAGRWRQEAAGWTQWTLCPGQAEEVAAPPPPPQQGEVGPAKIWESSRELIFLWQYFAAGNSKYRSQHQQCTVQSVRYLDIV